MVEEWVDHALDQARKLDIAEKAHAEADKKLKETLA